MEEEMYLRSIYDYLHSEWSIYQAQPRERPRVEYVVRQYAHNLPDWLYIELNEGRASGLFEHGHFEQDLSRSINMLQKQLNENE